MSWKPGQPVRLTTRRFVIRSMTPRDVTPTFLRWQNDPELRAGQNLPAGRVSRDAALKTLSRADNRRLFYLQIGATVAETPIGFFIVRADPRDLYAESTVVIGDRNWWGKGVVIEARARLIDFLFDDLGMHKVVGKVHARNTASIFNYKALGFVCEGVLREQLKNAADGTRLDQLVFGLLHPDWVARRDAGKATDDGTGAVG